MMKRIIITMLPGLFLTLSQSSMGQQYALDPQFGTGGRVAGFTYSNGDPISNFKFTSIALQNDGKIIVAGHIIANTVDAFRNSLIYRLNEDGSIDESFGNAGYQEISWTSIYDLLIGPGNKMYFCGDMKFNGANNQPVVHAVIGSADGVDDNSIQFGSGNEISSTFYSMAISDNKITCGGVTRLNSGKDRAFISRCNTSASGLAGKDWDFGGGDGYLSITDGTPSDWVQGNNTFYGITIAPNGKIIAVGDNYPEGDATSNRVYTRWNTNGTPDNTFYSNHNIASWNSGDNEIKAYGVTLDNSGNLCVAGFQNSSVNVNGYGTWLTSDFNTSASVYFYVPYSVYNSVSRHKNGMVYGGYGGENSNATQMCISRIKSSSEADTAFGGEGSATYPIPRLSGSTAERLYDIAVDEVGNIFAVGETIVDGLSRPIVVKLSEYDPSTPVNPVSRDLAAIKCYPNPVTEDAILEFDTKSNEDVSVWVMDMPGTVVYRAEEAGHVGRHLLSIPMNRLLPGIYILEMKSKDHRSMAKIKIVKQ